MGQPGLRRQRSHWGQWLSPGGALRRCVEVLRQQLWRVGDTLETRNAAHVHDVGCSFAFDNVHPVQVNAEGTTAVRGKLTQLRREREGLPVFCFFRPPTKELLDAKEPAPDPVNLAVAAVVRRSEERRVGKECRARWSE